MGRFTGCGVAKYGAISQDGALYRMRRFRRMGRCTGCGDFTGCGVAKDAANSQNGAISQGGVLTQDGAFYRIGVAQDAVISQDGAISVTAWGISRQRAKSQGMARERAK